MNTKKNPITLQKTLPLNLRAEFIFETFFEGNNSGTLHALRNFLAPVGEMNDRVFYLWGGAGSGKSHLLQAATHYINSMGKNAFYVSFDHIQQLKPSVLEQLENYQLICLDNIERMLHHPEWEEQLFCCLNLAEELDTTKIILSSAQNIHQLDCRLRETASRLASGSCYQILTLQEKDLISAFKIRASYRQIPISDEVIQYILHHITRDSDTLFGLLNQLDRDSLQQKKMISIPFVKQIITQTKQEH